MTAAVSVKASALGSDNASAGTVKITVPASTTAGDMLIAYVSGAFGPYQPSGWNIVNGSVSPFNATNISGAAYWRVATSSDAGTVQNFAFAGGSANGIMLVLSGANTAIAPTGAYYYNGGGPGSATVGPVTGNPGGAFVHFGALRTSGGANWPISPRGSFVVGNSVSWMTAAYFESLSTSVSASTTWSNLYTATTLAMVQVQGAILDDFPGAVMPTLPATVAADQSLLTTQSGEPGAGTNSAWAYFDAPTTSRYRASTVGSTSDTILEIYTGTALSNLVLYASDDDGGGAGTSRIIFDATAGTRYYFRVAVKAGTTPAVMQLVVDYDNRWTEEVLKDSPQLMWAFGDASVAAGVTDLSGYGRTGTFTSSTSEVNIDHNPVLTSFKGAFRGYGGYTVDSPNITWPSTGSITVEMMVYLDEYGKQTMVFCWPSTRVDLLYGYPGFLNYIGLNNGSNNVHGPPVPTAGWHHLAVVIPMNANSGTAKYYYDGVLQTAAFSGASFVIPAGFGTQVFRLGHWTGGWEISGWTRITGVAVFFTELTQARIQAHARAAVGVFSDRLVDFALIRPMPASMAMGYDSSAWTMDASEPNTDPATRTAWAAIDGDGGTYQLDTIGSTYDTSVAVYSGSPGALTLVASDSSSGGSNNAKVIWTAAAGTRYFLQVGASAGASPDYGTIYPRLTQLSRPGDRVTPVYSAASEPAHTTFLLKGRSTKAFDAQPGG